MMSMQAIKSETISGPFLVLNLRVGGYALYTYSDANAWTKKSDSTETDRLNQKGI